MSKWSRKWGYKRMKRALKWSSNLVTVILGIVLILTVYAAVTSRINGVPTLFGYQMYEVLSGSMEPEIRTGSIIFDKPGVDVKSLQEGDVITFRGEDDPKMLITHRIIQVKKQDGATAFQTKGDANDSADLELVRASNVVGKYTNLTIPYIGYYLNFMKSKVGIIILVIVPGVLLILTTLISLIREILKLENGRKSEVTTDSVPESTTKV